MTSLQTNAKLTDFKYIYFIAMLYMTLVILCSIVGFKLINTPFHIMSGASLVCPFLFLMGDIVAEVYGYKLVMRLFYSGLVCKLILVILSYSIISLPSPTEWNHQASYDLIIGNLPKIYGFSILGMTLSWIINAFVLTRWKYLVQGKYFWLRSITSSGIGEIIFSVISVSLTLLGVVPIYDIPSIVIWSFSLKLIFTVLFAYPMTLVVVWLKNNEEIDVYDNKFGLNPFKELVNES